MKKFALVIISVALVLSLLPAVQARQTVSCPVSTGRFQLGRTNETSIFRTFSINTSQLVTFRGRLLCEGFETTCDEGKPQIPFVTMRVPIPKGYRGTDVRISEASYEKTWLPQLDPYMPKTWSIPKLKSADNGELKGKYPETAGDFKFETGMSGNFATIKAFPVILDFDGKVMHVAKKLELQIVIEPENRFTAFSDDETVMKNSLILTSSALKAQAAKLAATQKDSGYTVEVVEVESLKGQYAPQKEEPEYKGPADFTKTDKEYMKKYDYDFAKSIRAYLQTKVGKVGFVTILGDGTHVPPSFYYVNSSYMKADRYVPSDIYYSSPDLDLVPNFALGRIPVRNPAEAEVMIEKIVNYKKSLSADWFHSAALCGGDPFSGGFEGELECQSIVDDGLVDNFKIEKKYKTAEKFNTSEMQDAFRKDNGFIYVVSHGSGDAIITEPGKITTDDIMALPKKSKLPILVSVACLNGMYDAGVVDYKFESYPNSKGLSFAQACMASPGGPVAYFGGTRLNYAGINWTIESGVVKAQPFSEIDRCTKEVMNAYHNWSPTLGEIMVSAFTKYTGIEKGFFSSNKTTFCFAFFGDPTIKLPATPEGAPHRMPEIDFKGSPMTKGRVSIPILSCIDSNTVSLRTDMTVPEVKVYDLDDDAKMIDKQPFKSSGDKSWSTSFKLKEKKVWHARIELPNNSEMWFYCLASAGNDLSLRNNTTFFTKKPGERLRFMLDVSNDGTKKMNNVEVSLLLDGKKTDNRKIKLLDVNEYRQATFVLDGMVAGTHNIRFEVKSDEKDQLPADNVFEKELVITNAETSKTGILISYLFNRLKADKVFGIDKFNQASKTLGTSLTELAKIGSDSYWEMVFGTRYENFKNLGCDTVFLATPDYTNPYNTSIIKALNDFAQSGGTIVGFDCLGQSTSIPVYSAITDVFGFTNQFDFDSETTKETFVNVTDSNHPIFAGIPTGKLKLNTVSANIPPNKNWSSCIDTATIAAKSDDNSQIVATNARNVYLSMLPKFESESEMKLLYNLSTYNLRPQPDASLTLSGLSCEPSRISVGETGKLVVTVKNSGNTRLEGVNVKIDQLSASDSIPSIDRYSEKTITFPIPKQEKPGILEFTGTATVDGDINTADNQATLRVRVFEAKASDVGIVITDLNIKDGDLLPEKDFQLSGKTSPDALVSVNGRLTRADLKGKFTLLAKPGATPLTISVKSTEGFESVKKIWCSFSPLSSIGGTIDKPFLMTSTEYIPKTDFIPMTTISSTNYVNITKTAGMLGLESNISGDEFTLGKDQFEVSGKVGSDKATVRVGEFKKEIPLPKPVMDKDGSVLMPFTAMLDLGFGGDIQAESQSFLLTFPKNTKTESFTPYPTSNVKAEDKTSFPAESDYGRSTLISSGPTDSEVSRVIDYNSTSRELYVWTTRGIEAWNKDGKFIRCLGLPHTASKDFDISWNNLLHPYADDYEHGSSNFLILPDGSLILKFATSVAFYDKDWKLEKIESFKDGGLAPQVPLQLTPDGNILFVDGDSIVLKYNPKGERLESFKLYDNEDSMLTEISTLQVLADGKILVYERPYYWFGPPDWSLYLFDSNHKLLKQKTVKYTEEKDEDFRMSPMYVIGDPDGTYWFITDDFVGVSVEHFDSDFTKIEKVNLGEGGLLTRGGLGDFRIDNLGHFWTKGKMNLGESDDVTLLASCGKDFILKPVINKCSDGPNKFLLPWDLNFDPEGNLIVYTSDYMTRYSRLGNKIENLSFELPKGNTLDFVWQLKFEGKYTTGIVESRESYVVMVAGSENKVVRMIPAITDEPIMIDDYATDFEKGEIYLAESESNTPIKVIPTYLADEKDPTQVEITRQFGVRGIGKGKFLGVSSMQRIGDKLYILDGIQSKVLVYSTKGDFLFEFGGFGTAPGKFNRPYSMQVDGKGFIWILDTRNSRIAVFDSDGTFISNLGRESIYSTPSSIDEYNDRPFDLLEPMFMAVSDGQLAIFEYTHERLSLLTASSTVTNLTVYPEKPVLEGYESDNQLTVWFTVTNTGSGEMSAEFTCEDPNATIEGGIVKNNAGMVKVTLDKTSSEMPKSVTLKIRSTLGEGTLTIPVVVKPVAFSFATGSMIAKSANGLVRLSRMPLKTDNGYILSTKDFPSLIPLTGVVAKDGTSVFFNHGNRKLGFEADKTYATLQVDLDTFKVDLGSKTEKTKDGGLLVPIDLISSFLSCQMIIEGNHVRVEKRK